MFPKLDNYEYSQQTWCQQPKENQVKSMKNSQRVSIVEDLKLKHIGNQTPKYLWKVHKLWNSKV